MEFTRTESQTKHVEAPARAHKLFLGSETHHGTTNRPLSIACGDINPRKRSGGAPRRRLAQFRHMLTAFTTCLTATNTDTELNKIHRNGVPTSRKRRCAQGKCSAALRTRAFPALLSSCDRSYFPPMPASSVVVHGHHSRARESSRLRRRCAASIDQRSACEKRPIGDWPTATRPAQGEESRGKTKSTALVARGPASSAAQARRCAKPSTNPTRVHGSPRRKERV